MRRAFAIVLAGCMVIQPLSGCCLTVDASETVIVSEQSGADVVAVDTVGTENDGTDVVAADTVGTENGGTDALAADTVGTENGGTDVVTADMVGTENGGTDALAADIVGTENREQGDVTETDPSTDAGIQEPDFVDGSFDASGTEIPEDGVLSDDVVILDEVVELDDIEDGMEPVTEAVSESEPVPESEQTTESELMAESEEQSESESESEFGLALEDLSAGIQTVSLDEWDRSCIEVKVVATLPFLDSEEVAVSLVPVSDGASGTYSGRIQIAVPGGASGEKTAAAVEKFSVAPGSYQLTLRADKFAEYVQTVEVEAHETAKLEVCTSRVDKCGWLRLGDVNEDQDITDEDVQELVSAIHANSIDSALDLNANGAVDLADLQFAVQGLGETQEASVTKCSVPRCARNGEQTKIDGIDSLLSDTGKATLSPTNGEAISRENPVSIAFDFGAADPGTDDQAGAELPVLGGMTLQAPVERDEKTGALSSDITGGSVLVEAEEDGETVVYEIPLVKGTEPVKSEPAETAAVPVPEVISGSETTGEPETADEPGTAGGSETAGEPETVGGADAAEAPEASAGQEEAPAAVMLMTVGMPADALSVDAADAISVDAVEEIDAADVPAEVAEVGERSIADEMTGNTVAEETEGPKTAAEEEPSADRILEAVALEMDGSFVLDFGTQIAVKRVTIRITGTKQTEALAEIARVQFVNNMEDRIPAPNLNIPEIREILSKNEELEVDWNEQANVTGYEIEISGPVKKAEDQTQIVRVLRAPYTISAINDKSLYNYRDYKIRIRSVNGEWSSPWTETRIAQPAPENPPDRVDNVVASGSFRSVRVSWKDMDDANGYMVFYREKGAQAYRPVVADYALPKEGTGRLMQNSYTITGLQDLTAYEVYVVAWNDYDHGSWGNNAPGTAAGPRVAEATTESGDTPRLPRYQLINTYGGSYDDKAEGAVGKLTDHIVSAVCGTHNGQKMVESPLDQAKEAEAGKIPTVNGKQRQYAQWALGTVDNSYSSYWTKKDWDDGVAYPIADFSKGVTVTFDQPYAMNYLTFTAADLQGNVETAQIVYWKDEDEINADAAGTTIGCSVVRSIDETNRPYYVVKFDEKITAQQLHLYIGTTYAKIDLKIAEIHFHHYNEAVDGAVEALFADPEHSMLSEELAALAAADKAAAKAEIDRVKAIVDTKDALTGEYHPLRDFLLLDLEGAKELVDLQLDEPFYVDNTITAARDRHLNFGGLNAWQPLGRVAASGEKLIVYVGHNAKSIRQNASLQLIFTQYYAESNALARSYNLKVGKNEITVPEITTTGGKERGGQLYVAYTGNNTRDQYVVRINGGAKIPTLNIHNKSETDKKAAVSAYVAELGEYVAKLEAEHDRLHYNEAEAAKKDKNGVNNSYVYFPYKEQSCFLNATDLMADHMMYSVPATQIWAALGNYASNAEKAAAVESALGAMEKTMTLFYQHKGLFRGAGGSKETPAQHLNIRYMQMFSGAFMYASGNHIGVEFPETKLAMSTSWDGYGWGVAHEIGHDINDPHYAIAEITNNYFAQLLTKAANADHATRFKYEDVYEKVTSGAIGRSPNGAVQLALYWQLHLAFDDYTENVDGYRDDRYIFDDYKTMFDNLFFARVDTYSRDPGSAPKNENKDRAVDLKLGKDVDQNLMRLACAAAQENMLPFFTRWGMAPDEETKAFAAQYGEPTEKAYYYVNDDARNYRADHKDDEESLKISEATAGIAVDETKTADNRVALRLSTDADETRRDAILGYEIVRSTYRRGKKQDAEVIGFALADANGEAVYTDTIASLDNRVLYYEARAVDKFLNYSRSSDTAVARVSTGGVLGKKLWSVETTVTAAEGQDKVLTGDDHPDGGFDADSRPAVEYGVGKVIDGLIDDGEAGPFLGTAAAGDRIVIDMQKPMEITSVRYTGKPLGPVTVSVSSDRSVWVTVKENYEFTGTDESGKAQTIWFDAVQANEKEKWIGTYDARYVQFTLHQAGSVEIDEIDICGSSGDDVSFYGDVEQTVGIAANTCTYAYDEDGSPLTIPAGALIFTGSYKGNPAYNMVMLYDDAVVETEDGSVRHGNVVGADLETDSVYAEQVILADVPENGNLGETSDGKWIYFVTPPDEAYWTDPVKVREHSKAVYEGILKEGRGRVRAELYRVDNALTLEGERIVSDTAFLTLPESFEKLGDITLSIALPEQKQLKGGN